MFDTKVDTSVNTGNKPIYHTDTGIVPSKITRPIIDFQS
jgi:hypothetical protein